VFLMRVVVVVVVEDEHRRWGAIQGADVVFVLLHLDPSYLESKDTLAFQVDTPTATEEEAWLVEADPYLNEVSWAVEAPDHPLVAEVT